MKSRFPKVRSCIEKAFIAWYRGHEMEWKRPLIFVRRTDGSLSFTLPGLSPAVQIYLHSYEFGVYAKWQDQEWDRLMSYVTSIEHTDNGYFDRCTLPDYRIVYSTRESLWQAEMFEPLMNWINNKLLPAKWLGLYKQDESDGEQGATWAELLAKPDSDAFVLLPLWLDQNSTQTEKKLRQKIQLDYRNQH